MDTYIYIGTAILTIGWSVWSYRLWTDRADLPEDSGGRFFLIIGPTGFFLITVLAGWEKILLLRLDLIGILALDLVTIVAIISLIVLFSIKRQSHRRGYTWIVVLYFITAFTISVLSHVVKLFPTVLIRISDWVRQGIELDFFKFTWLGLDPETNENDLIGMLNKIVIALCSYIPISLIRFMYWNRQRRRFLQQIKNLERRIESIEKVSLKKGE